MDCTFLDILNLQCIVFQSKNVFDFTLLLRGTEFANTADRNFRENDFGNLNFTCATFNFGAKASYPEYWFVALPNG